MTIKLSIGLYFELLDPVTVAGAKKDSPEIKMHFDATKKNMLTAFTIFVTDFEQDSIDSAYQKAYRLTNLLTLKTGLFVFHKTARKNIAGNIHDTVTSGGTDALLTKLFNLDLEQPDIENLINLESRINQQLTHFSNGSKALESQSFAEAVREFYQVIEHEVPSHLVKFKYLRDGLSHAELSVPKTIDQLKNPFGIICIENPVSSLSPKGLYVNISDPAVLEIVKKEAKIFRDEVLRYLDNKINIKTN